MQRGGGQAGLGEELIGHGQQPLSVLLGPFVLPDADLQTAVDRPQKGHATTGRRSFQSQQV
ncbi:hypothetical protein D3C72_2529510 [compost metagenome]